VPPRPCEIGGGGGGGDVSEMDGSRMCSRHGNKRRARRTVPLDSSTNAAPASGAGVDLPARWWAPVPVPAPAPTASTSWTAEDDGVAACPVAGDSRNGVPPPPPVLAMASLILN
jgi:hypothetical protein